MYKVVLVLLLFGTALVCAEKIIIIGAGAAGIAAASKLLDQNISDFRILEADNRIGGRIQSLYFGNAYVEIGAEFVRGTKDDIIYQLTKNYVKPKETYAHTYYMGHTLTQDNLLPEMNDIFDEIGVPENINVTVGKAFLERYSKILSKYKDNPEKYRYAQNFIRIAECFVLAFEGGYSWFSLASYPTMQRIHFWSWNGLGFKNIFDILLKNFPNKNGYNIDHQISFNKTVSRIIRNEKSVDIKCADGSEYTADHVVFTPSLGVLKHDHQKLFEPSLTDEKIRAITNLGFDGVIKLIFEFPNNWFGNEHFFIFVWTEEEMKNIFKEYPNGPTKDGEHWLTWFNGLRIISSNNLRVVEGFVFGPLVPEVEKLSEQEIKNGTMYVIRKFLSSKFNITKPTRVIHSRFVTNPNIRGAFSYDTIKSMESSPKARELLLKPITGKDAVPRILFAGEATCPHRSGSVNCAIKSGFREAERLAQILKI